MGVSLKHIASGLAKTRYSGMRTDLKRSELGFTVVNDAYNSSPTAMKAALEWVAQLRGFQRKMLIIGDMLELGPQEVHYHYELGGQIDPQQFDYVLTYGELAAHTARAAKENFPETDVRSFRDKAELAAWALARLAPGDLAFVKGSRGMKMEEIVQMLIAGKVGGR